MNDDLLCTCYPTLAPSPAPSIVTTERPSIAPTEQGDYLSIVLNQDFQSNSSLTEEEQAQLRQEIANAYGVILTDVPIFCRFKRLW